MKVHLPKLKKSNGNKLSELAEQYRISVSLCRCQGKLSEVLPLEEIRQFLNKAVPDIRVEIDDDICRSDSDGVYGDYNHRVVIGACSKLAPKHDFWHEATNNHGDINYTRIVDIFELISNSYDEIGTLEKVKLMLLAQIKRLAVVKESYCPNYDIRFSIPKNEVDRRHFFNTALPRYELKPRIESSKCLGADKCGLCSDVCSDNAISCYRDNLSIDGSVCSGCGLCMNICPNEAIAYSAYSQIELEGELEGLLYEGSNHSNPRVVALSCLNYLPVSEYSSGHGFQYSSNILPVEVPCLSVISPRLLLRAFEMGAQGLALLANEDKCNSKSCPSVLEDNIRFVQSVLDCMNIDKERVKILRITPDNRSSIKNELHTFIEGIAKLNPTPFKYDDRALLADGEPGIHALIDRMLRKLSHFKKGIVSTSGIYLGQIAIDSNECTNCDLCALNCPTDALSRITSSNKESQLLFDSKSCIACGVCVNICPQKCIELLHILEMDKACGQELILLTTDIARCSSCGKEIAPKTMINKLREKLAEAGCENIYLDLCPVCRSVLQTTGQMDVVDSSKWDIA